MYNTHAYARKPNKVTQESRNISGIGDISGTDDITIHLVDNLSIYTNLQGNNISMDQ